MRRHALATGIVTLFPVCVSGNISDSIGQESWSGSRKRKLSQNEVNDASETESRKSTDVSTPVLAFLRVVAKWFRVPFDSLAPHW